MLIRIFNKKIQYNKRYIHGLPSKKNKTFKNSSKK